jgi:hypothetical protein
VEARLTLAADCYRIADAIPGAFTTPVLPGILPALRFVFDVDDVVCTLQDVQPLARFPTITMPAAQGWSRLALELALDSGDARLTDHLALAIVRDEATVVSRRLTEAELLERRADGWARVYAHLAGDPQPLMGRRGPHPEDPRAVWLKATFLDAGGGLERLRQLRVSLPPHYSDGRREEPAELWAVGAKIEHRSSGKRGYRVPTAQRKEIRRWARKLAGVATVVIEWGGFGDGTAGSVRCLGQLHDRLPGGRRAPDGVVQQMLRKLEADVRESGVLRLPGRRLDAHAGHVAAYLLKDGHDRLAGHSWRATAEAFFGRALPAVANGMHPGPEHDTVRGHYDAAKRLMSGWRQFASPR